jgi:hypothetical protein
VVLMNRQMAFGLSADTRVLIRRRGRLDYHLGANFSEAVNEPPWKRDDEFGFANRSCGKYAIGHYHAHSSLMT